MFFFALCSSPLPASPLPRRCRECLHITSGGVEAPFDTRLPLRCLVQSWPAKLPPIGRMVVCHDIDRIVANASKLSTAFAPTSPFP